MSDLISRDDAIEAINELVSTMSVCVSTDECRGMNWMKQRAIKAVENLPTAERVGKWIAKPSRWCVSDIVFECSECGSKSDFPTYYCPYCGSRNERMRGEEDEERLDATEQS